MNYNTQVTFINIFVGHDPTINRKKSLTHPSTVRVSMQATKIFKTICTQVGNALIKLAGGQSKACRYHLIKKLTNLELFDLDATKINDLRKLDPASTDGK